MRREASMYEVIKLYKRVWPGISELYANKEHTRSSLASLARTISESILTDPTEVETLSIYNYILETLEGQVTETMLSRNLKRIIANKHLLSLGPDVLRCLDDDVEQLTTSGVFGGLLDTSVDTINAVRGTITPVYFTCVTGPLAGIRIIVWVRPGMHLAYGCGLPKRDKYLIWSYFVRCHARITVRHKENGGTLEYVLTDVQHTPKMQQFNKEILAARTDTNSGPSCRIRTQYCALCDKYDCCLSLFQTKKGENNVGSNIVYHSRSGCTSVHNWSHCSVSCIE